MNNNKLNRLMDNLKFKRKNYNKQNLIIQMRVKI